MSRRIWKEYVHRHIETVEGSLKPITEDPETKIELGGLTDDLEAEAQSWCPTFDRCMAYTFEYYCKLVFGRALQYAHTKNEYTVTPDHIRECAKQLFNTSESSNVSSHDCGRCVSLYQNYASWNRRTGYRIYGKPYYNSRNLSFKRSRNRMLHSQNNDNRAEKELVSIDLGKYEHIAPKHKTLKLSLDKVFST
ncbi:hypothetical protein BgAZ_109850 [Babesia gibsoni]|uniref:Uncharacterized protein n=1 Tax=Babesia gibsoni TaxID=33632 RepID=A0AAD8UWN6_BABGI|nr:hypothetical protein BgAZ_109850 [Babesia gibsoni]